MVSSGPYLPGTNGESCVFPHPNLLAYPIASPSFLSSLRPSLSLSEPCAYGASAWVRWGIAAQPWASGWGARAAHSEEGASRSNTAASSSPYGPGSIGTSQEGTLGGNGD